MAGELILPNGDGASVCQSVTLGPVNLEFTGENSTRRCGRLNVLFATNRLVGY